MKLVTGILTMGRGVHPSMHWARHPPGKHPPGQTTPPGRPLQYASYWNAFLSYHVSNCNQNIRKKRISKCIFLMSSRLLFRFDFRLWSSTHIKWHLLNFNILVLICTENLKCIVWILDDLIFQVKICVDKENTTDFWNWCEISFARTVCTRFKIDVKKLKCISCSLF